MIKPTRIECGAQCIPCFFVLVDHIYLFIKLEKKKNPCVMHLIFKLSVKFWHHVRLTQSIDHSNPNWRRLLILFSSLHGTLTFRNFYYFFLIIHTICTFMRILFLINSKKKIVCTLYNLYTTSSLIVWVLEKWLTDWFNSTRSTTMTLKSFCFDFFFFFNLSLSLSVVVPW